MREPDDHEWLLARERGEDVSHVPEDTRTAYQQLEQLLTALPEPVPSAGWKDRVLAALDSPGPPGLAAPPRHGTPARSRRMWPIAGGTAAATALTLMCLLPDRGTDGRLAESIATSSVVMVLRGEQPHRGENVSIGDVLVVVVKANRPVELRVYGDTGEPLARCADSEGCALERDAPQHGFRFELVLRSPGDVRTVLFAGDAIPRAFDNLNADLEAAQRANVSARQVSVVHVQ